MKTQYKLVLTSSKLYREVEISEEISTGFCIGTTKNCGVRFSRELFFDDFELYISCKDESWSTSCKDNIFISEDGVLKLKSLRLEHGVDFSVFFSENGSEIFKASFLIDFESREKSFTRSIDISNSQTITIGGRTGADIELVDELLGTDTISLTRTNEGFEINDNNSKYGVLVNNVKVENSKLLKDYDFFSVVSHSFFIKGAQLFIPATPTIKVNLLAVRDIFDSQTQMTYPYLNINTRIKYKIPNEPIEVLDPPQKQKPPKKNILLSLIPAVAMLAMVVLLRGVMGGGGSFVIFSVVSMSIGIFTSIFSYVDERKNSGKDEKERKAKYLEYIKEKEQQIAEYRQEEVELLNISAPKMNETLNTVFSFGRAIFERKPTDDDFLSVRIGTGNVKAIRKINYKKPEIKNTDDVLAEIPANLYEKYLNIENAPVFVRLAAINTLGIVGESDESIFEVAKLITIDLSTYHYYNDLRLSYFVDKGDIAHIEWVKWLRHTNTISGQRRNIIYDESSKNEVMDELYQLISSRAQNEKQQKLPHFVVFVLEQYNILQHPISKYISKANEYGFTFIFASKYEELLPPCSRLIRLKEEEPKGTLIWSDDGHKVQAFNYDIIPSKQANTVAQKLAPVDVQEVSLSAQLVKTITLFRLLKVLAAEDLDLATQWARSEVYKSMAAPLGVNSKSETVFLDLNEKKDGPHGLVAGTTGSGKSEIMQTYILSMATLFHPYEVGFVIIDFKGGGMVNQFKSLPHLVGSITNIDGREIDRSLLSIKAELRKRQTLFAEAGVNHIDPYIKKFKAGEVETPLPHLILIVDEFAELKTDQPEFMKELISAARIGRSLGVHLILATQKPSGVVDDQIWSNSRFKLCLKVQTPEDSKEMLKTPLAAEIKEPGRAYLQVGNNEVFELFQSAYSGAYADSEISVSGKSFDVYEVDLGGGRKAVYSKKPDKNNEGGKTQLEAIVDLVSGYCNEAKIAKLPGICLPPLEDMIVYPSVKVENSEEITVNVGILDDPENQRQNEITLNFERNNTLIVGSSQFGKTNLLQTIIRAIAEKFTPQQVTILILDFASMALNVFSPLKHIGGVITSSDDENLKTFFRMVQKEIASRKEIFAQIGITSFTSYKATGNTDLPFMLILVDNFIAAKELFPDYDDIWVEICREGIAVGVSVIFTGQQPNIGYKLLSNFGNRICFSSNDSSTYSVVFDHCRVTPKSVPGRGLTFIDNKIYEFQAYLAFDGNKEIDRVQQIKTFIEAKNAEYIQFNSSRIPVVPSVLTAESLKGIPVFAQNKYLAGINCDLIEPAYMNLGKGYVGVCGKENSSQSTFIKYFASNFNKENVFVIDNGKRELQNLCIGSNYFTTADSLTTVLPQIEKICDVDLENIYTNFDEYLAKQDYHLLVINNRTLFSSSEYQNAVYNLILALNGDYKDVKLIVLISQIENNAINYSSCNLLKHIKENPNVFLFDDLQNCKLLEVPHAVNKYFKKPIQAGDCYYFCDAISKIRTPII